MQEKIMRILKMVEEGKIDSEKASELIEALKSVKEEPVAISTSRPEERMLRVNVLSKNNDTVNVTLPIKLVKSVISIFGKLPINHPSMENIQIDTQAIIEAIDNDIHGKIVDVKSAEGDIVEVSID